MEYTLIQGPIEAKIIKQCMREGWPLPDRIANAPILRMGLELYYDAFWELTSCRSTAFSVGPIPWTAAMDYARAYEFDGEQTEDLMYFIREMDMAYMEIKSKKSTSCPSPAASTNSKGAWG